MSVHSWFGWTVKCPLTKLAHINLRTFSFFNNCMLRNCFQFLQCFCRLMLKFTKHFPQNRAHEYVGATVNGSITRSRGRPINNPPLSPAAQQPVPQVINCFFTRRLTNYFMVLFCFRSCVSNYTIRKKRTLQSTPTTPTITNKSRWSLSKPRAAVAPTSLQQIPPASCSSKILVFSIRLASSRIPRYRICCLSRSKLAQRRRVDLCGAVHRGRKVGTRDHK